MSIYTCLCLYIKRCSPHCSKRTVTVVQCVLFCRSALANALQVDLMRVKLCSPFLKSLACTHCRLFCTHAVRWFALPSRANIAVRSSTCVMVDAKYLPLRDTDEYDKMRREREEEREEM